MAATYTEISIEDMEKFLKRGFRALRPKQVLKNGEVVFDLGLSQNVAIRVYTSIRPSSGMGAGKGSDSIKILLWGPKLNRPLTSGKAAPIVKRTEGWRNSLQDRIEGMMELYEEKEKYWEERGVGVVAPPKDYDQDDRGTDQEDQEEAPQAPSGELLTGTFTRLRDGSWGAKITGKGSPGARALLETKGGRKVPVTLETKTWSGRDNYGGMGFVEVWSIQEKQRMAAETGPDYDYDRN